MSGGQDEAAEMIQTSGSIQDNERRERIAVAAMQGLLAADPESYLDTDLIACWAIEQADELIKQLDS